MIRSSVIAFLLAISLALFFLASWGKVEMSTLPDVPEVTSKAVASPEISRILSEKISDEIWREANLERQIDEAVEVIPSELGFLEGTAKASAKSALETAVSTLLQTTFAEDIWREGLLLTRDGEIVKPLGEDKMFLVEREVIYLDLSSVARQALKEIGLPRIIWGNVPGSLGSVELLGDEVISSFKTNYSIVSFSPLIPLIFTFLFVFLLTLSERKTFWRAGALLSGSLLASYLFVFISAQAFLHAPSGGGESQLLRAFQEMIFETARDDLLHAAKYCLYLALPLLLVSLLFSPFFSRLRKLRAQNLEGSAEKLKDEE